MQEAPCDALKDRRLKERYAQLFQMKAEWPPAGDQPTAIASLVDGLQSGLASQTLLGVTGSGKTFTIANVIQQLQRPALIMAPNKTLAAQLYGEFKEFFQNNAEIGRASCRGRGCTDV